MFDDNTSAQPAQAATETPAAASAPVADPAQPAPASDVPPVDPAPATDAAYNTTAVPEAAPTDSTPSADNSAPAPTAPPEPAAPPASDAAASGNDDLVNIKQQALQSLSPLLGQLDQTPEEKFRTTMMMIQASDNQALIKDAYEAAQAITDEKAKAQALLDVVNEINYFTQHPAS